MQPRLVAADLDWLSTLPAREVSHGLAEVVKMGLLAGGGFFENLQRYLSRAREGEEEALQALILHSVRFKARVVAEDELERGRRAILNYGHTVGHGLEVAAGYALPHGEAISAGMISAAHLSRKRFDTDLMELHQDLLQAAGLPQKVSGIRPEDVLVAMSRDKKRRSGDDAEYRFVLLEDIGKPLWGVPVGEDEARRAIGVVVG